MSAVLDVIGERVALGPLRRELYPLHVEWVNEPDVGGNVFGKPQSRTLEEEGPWLDRESADPASAFFLIYRRDGEAWRPIGVTSLTQIDRRRGTATFRILIGDPADRGRGYGTEAIRLVLDHAFRSLGLHNVILQLNAWNEAGRRAYEKAGFREIGRRREAAPRDGVAWDVIYMDCLASEFTGR